MKYTKKLMALGLSTAMVFGMTACGSSNNSSSSADTKAAAAETTAAAGSAAASADSDAPFAVSDYGLDINCMDFLSGEYTELPADGPTYNFSVAHASTETSDGHLVLVDLKNALEYYSGGKITLTIYPNGQMGSDSEMISSCIAGDIDIVYQSGSTHATFVPETVIFDTPFLFTGYDFDKTENIILDSEFRDLYNEANEKAGLVCLMLRACETMNLTSNRAVNSLEDLKGLKIRTAQAESRMAIWTALGANPTPLAFSELYMALQNGTVDAQDNLLGTAVVSGLAEQQKYLIPTRHMVAGFDMTMNKDKFYSMPEEYQAFLREICKELSLMDATIGHTKEEGYYQQLQDDFGLEVCEISDDFAAQLKEAAAPAIEQVKGLVGNDELYSTLEKLLNQ